ncbi:MAG: hypothetical protein IPN60_09315 [Saprospiraceae bacterium]|nr:hypothetical protein [Candidatus Opimibacter skivensis]
MVYNFRGFTLLQSRNDSIDFMFMVYSAGDTFRTNHSAFHLSGNDLYLRAEKKYFIYDVVKRSKENYSI